MNSRGGQHPRRPVWPPVSAFWLAALSILASAAAPPCLLAGESDDPYLTTHVLIGMTPNQGFEVTCEDSVLFRDPVVSSGLGIVEFIVDYRADPLPNTISVRVPAAPVITGEGVPAPGDSGAVVVWRTDRPATSQVEYGRTASYGTLTPLEPRLTTYHEVAIGPLEAETTYHFRVSSIDAFGNKTTSGDRTFQTLPEAPRVFDVTVADTTTTTVTLLWSTTRPCDSRVEYGPTVNYGSATPVDPTLVTSHSVTVTGLTPYTVYHLRAASKDGLGRTAYSSDQTVTTRAPALLIAGVAVADTTATTATIVWSTTNPATSRVDYGLLVGYGHTVSDERLVGSHVLILQNLEESTLYHFRVISRDAYGAEVTSSDHTFRTTPGDFVVSSVDIGDVGVTTIELVWITTRAADSQVEYGPGTGYGGVTDVIAELVTEHSVTVGSLAPGTTYHLRGRSRDVQGHVALSADRVATTLTPELRIEAVTVADTTATTASLAWTTTNPATAYVEYGPTSSYGSLGPGNAVPSTHHATFLVDLEPRTVYHFRIHAEDIYGQEQTSGDLVFTTPPLLHPGGLIITGVAVASAGPTYARIAWHTNEEASSTVEYGTTPSLGSAISDDALVISHSMLVSGLAPATLYYYRVLSEDAGEHQAVSQSHVFTTMESDFVPPEVPEGLAASACEDGIAVSWLPNSEDDLEGYRLYRRAEGEAAYALLAEFPPAQTSYTDRDVAAARFYEYAVAAFDAVGNESARSDPASAASGLDAGANVWIFPNPVREGATIRFALPSAEPGGDVSVAIYAAGGRLVRSLGSGEPARGLSTVRWNADDERGAKVASGTYFCVVTFSTGVLRAKLIVLR
jgi:hypothetical protein